MVTDDIIILPKYLKCGMQRLTTTSGGWISVFHPPVDGAKSKLRLSLRLIN